MGDRVRQKSCINWMILLILRFLLSSWPLDMRLPSSQAAESLRSINLAISARGISAIESIDPAVARRFMENVIPMKGRMIHDLSGAQHSQLYDGFGRVCIS